MHQRILVAGFGGQGILLLGNVLCHAGMEEGYHVSWLPSYGPEMRGGTASCSVTISDEEIGNPIVTRPDILVAMNQPSFDKYMPAVRQGGLLLANASLIHVQTQREDIRIIQVPATDTAIELGNLRTANMVMLGALLSHVKMLPRERVARSLAAMLGSRRQHLLGLNEKAMALGAERMQAFRAGIGTSSA